MPDVACEFACAATMRSSNGRERPIAAVGRQLPSDSRCFSILQIGDERLGGAIAISAFKA